MPRVSGELAIATGGGYQHPTFDLQINRRFALTRSIVELQEPSIGSFLTLTLLFPLCYLLTPFTRPSLSEYEPSAPVLIAATLFFTYILPLIPFALTFDGLVSAYRTRPPEHVMHLANLASIRMSLEKEMAADEEWKWTWGYKRHTWPFGRMVWVIGRKERE